MIDLEAPLATLPDVELSTHDFLAALRRTLRLHPLLLEALAETVTIQAARAAGLSVSSEALQQAANRFRRQHGLRSPDQVHTWLREHGLRMIDFEAMLEHTLLVDRFRQHLSEGRLEEHVAAQPDRYAHARVSHIAVPSEGLARELLARILDEGADFADLASRYAQPGPESSRANAIVMRAELPAGVAEVVFQARPDSVVGPVATQHGWLLFHVHERLPLEFDESTKARARQDLFDSWLAERLAPVRIDLSGLDQP
jgi:peptidylprolyl isomerase